MERPQVERFRRIQSQQEVRFMKEKFLSVSCVYAQCGQSAAELIRESFHFFLKKELIALDVLPKM